MYYNLIISGDDKAWESTSFLIDKVRCIKEYTDKNIVDKYSGLSEDQVDEIKKFPCIFAYESSHKKNPRYGFITEVVSRQGKVKIEYNLIDVGVFLTYDDLDNYSFDLDIYDWELNRTHWAIKNIDLYKFLKKMKINISVPVSYSLHNSIIDITTHIFDIAFSFPGEVRNKVEQIVIELGNKIGNSNIFYDNYYKAQLARPSLDILLQDIYRNRSKLIVVFLCEKYQEKEWCNLEFRAIRDIIKQRHHEKIMLIKMDQGKVDGVFSTDGYIDGSLHTADEIAMFIKERLEWSKLKA